NHSGVLIGWFGVLNQVGDILRVGCLTAQILSKLDPKILLVLSNPMVYSKLNLDANRSRFRLQELLVYSKSRMSDNSCLCLVNRPNKVQIHF
ncbi:hypothetical protein DD581_33990, partial [Klebsiella pneumoniae]